MDADGYIITNHGPKTESLESSPPAMFRTATIARPSPPQAQAAWPPSKQNAS